jgi:transposase
MDAHPPVPPAIWEHTPPGAQALIVAPAAALAPVRAAVAQVKATVEALAQRLGRNAGHSSQPPSADPPPVRRRSRRESSGRRPGGPPGHEGQTRARIPADAVDVRMPVKPRQCPRCQQPWRGNDPQPQRQQVPESPSVRPVVTEDPRPQRCCPACGAVTRGERPAGVPTGGFGPRVQAMTALGPGASPLSQRTTPRVMADLGRLPLSVGTLANLEHATVQALAVPVAEARREVPQPPAADLDAPGWREGPPRAWRWTAGTAAGTVLVGRRSRRGQVARELVGERFWGWLGTDRWRA